MSALAYDPERPWYRQPFDTELGFALFSDYLQLPIPRRVQDIAKRAGLPWTQVEGMAMAAWWRERAGLWDEHLADIRILTIERVTEETAEEVARRQLILTRIMQRLAGKEFAALEKEADLAEGRAGTITTRDAIRMATNGVTLERLIRGEATERTSTGPDVSKLSLAELRAARELQDKAGIR